LTPNFEQAGPKEAQVTIRAERQDLTIVSTSFKFYLNTKADKTLAFGPGILEKNHLGTETSFYVQARNSLNENRQSGADKFSVEIYRNEDYVEDDEEKTKKVFVEPITKDLDDGQYLVKYVADIEGDFFIDVKYVNEEGEEELIRGAPFKCTHTAEAKPTDNEFTGSMMVSNIQKSVARITEFLATSNAGVDTQNSDYETNVYSLLKIKETAKNFNISKDKTVLELDVMTQCLANFEKLKAPRNKDFESCKKLTADITNLEKKCNETDKKITTNIKSEATKRKEEIKTFEDELKVYLLGLKQKPIYKYDTGAEGARELVGAIDSEVSKFQEDFKKFIYFAEMFEYPDVIEQSKKNLDMITKDTSSIKCLWEHIKTIQDQFNIWLKTPWGKVNGQDMADDIKSLNKQLTSLPNLDRKSNVFTGIAAEIKSWNIFLPLIQELKNEAMQADDDRHWNKCRE